MNKNHFPDVIDDLCKRCGDRATKADLARRINTLFPGETISAQTINNWRQRGIPVARVHIISREFDYPAHKIRPGPFLPPAVSG